MKIKMITTVNVYTYQIKTYTRIKIQIIDLNQNQFVFTISNIFEKSWLGKKASESFFLLQ